MSHAPTPSAADPRRETVIVFALSLAAMVVSMMQTLPVPILGLIRTDLGTSTANVSWVTTATLLSAAVFTPLLGRFGDQHGKKPTLVAVLGVMVVGSVVAALATSLPLLILGRVLQGAATAIFPLALSVLREEVRPQKLPGAMSLVSGTLAFGSGLALVATGLLTSGSDADYRSAFWMATGFAALALLAVVFLVPATRHKTGGRTDFLGALTLGITLLLLLLPISQGHEWGWASARTLGSFARRGGHGRRLGAHGTEGPRTARRHEDVRPPSRAHGQPGRHPRRLRHVRELPGRLVPGPDARGPHRLRLRRLHPARLGPVPAARRDRLAARLPDRRSAGPPPRPAHGPRAGHAASAPSASPGSPSTTATRCR